MTKLYFLLVALWLLSLRPAGAQTTDSLRLRLSQVFANVDKRQVPTGRLLEYAEPLLPMEYFDGLRLDDTSRTTLAGWRALYVTAATARVAGSDTLPGLLAVNARLKAASPATPGAGPVPIALEYVAYAAVRHDAFSQNLLSIQNEQVYDVPGRSQSPYQLQVLFAAAPAFGFAPTGNVAFVLRRNLYLADGTPGTPALYLDFDDGRGYLRATWDQPLATTYATAGVKHVKVKVIYTASGRGGTILVMDSRESHFSFEVLSAGQAARYASDSTSHGFTRLISPRPGVHGGALVSVRYGRNNPGTNKQILKPLIVVEQYNIARTAPHLIRCNNPNNTAETFLAAITDNTNPFNFNDHLEAADYDLVYIDFTDNLDYLTNNAQLFEEVVRWVNQKKLAAGSTAQNVVMGLSMGGLIARYGLAEMTRRGNDNPDTRLLVLHDSPQRGAYNPLGVQAVTRALNEPIVNILGIGLFKLSNFSDEFSETVDVMDRGATRDLSILYATNGTGGYNTNRFLEGAGSPYRQMVDNVPSPAYTIVATSDGSQCGIAQGIAPSTELSHSAFNLFAYLGPQGIIFGNKSIRSDVSAYALPAYGQQARLSHVRIYYDIRLFPWWLPIPISLKINIRPTQEFASPPNTLPYENLPGGNTLLTEASRCANSFNYTLNGWAFYGMSINTTFYNGPICFVPTYSALDVETVTPSNSAAQYSNGVTTSPSPPRVARYIAQQSTSGIASTYNLNHLAYTARNGEWIFNEMQRPFNGSNYVNTVGCSSECTALPTITSSLPAGQRLCQGQSATFSIPNLAAGTVVTWSATPASNFTVATGSGPTFTTSSSATAAGNSTITATVGPCQVSASITVPTGPGEPRGYYNNNGGGASLTTYQYVGAGSTGPTDVSMFIDDPYNFTFTADSPDVYLTNTQGRSTHFVLRPGQGVTITATATNAPCGLVGRFAFIYPSSGRRLSAAPNPASTELLVTRAPADAQQTKPDEAFTADLYDTHGKKVKTKKSEQNNAVLDVRDLPSGLYNLRAGAGKNALSDHIQITH